MYINLIIIGESYYELGMLGIAKNVSGGSIADSARIIEDESVKFTN